MSLIDRQQEAARNADTQTVPAPPVTPGGPPPTFAPPMPAPEAKPYKHLVLIAAALVLIAIVSTAAILLTRTQAGSQPNAAPPPATAAAPSTTPTLTAKQQAAAAAIARYTAYVKAYDESALTGSDAASAARVVKEYTVDPQSSIDTQSDKAARAGKYVSTGYSKVTARVDSISSLSAKVPVAMLTTCTDRTGVKITKAGKPIPPTFRFIKGTITMKRINGRWMVANTVNPNQPDRQSCTV